MNLRHNRPGPWIITGLVVAFALAFAFRSGAAPVRAADGGAQLIVGVQQEPATLNPVLATLATESDVFNLVFDGLFRHDAAGRLVPDLATRVPTRENGDVSADGRTITYHLVRNARWHDGVPVTSEDVKFTWEAIVDPRNIISNRNPYEEFERVDTPDAATVVVRMKRPWAPMLDAAFSDYPQGAIVPAHLLRGAGNLNRDPFNAAPVGSGPYRFVSWQRGVSMTFAANPAYFRGPPSIARITWRFVPSDNTIAAELRAGELDFVDSLQPAPYAQLGAVAGLIPALGPSLGWEHLTFNTSREPLADQRVRRALCEAMDVRELYAKIAHGAGELGVGLQHPRSPWYLRSLRPCLFDPAGAERLLDAAGWRRGPDGIRSKDGRPLAIVFGTPAGYVDREQTQILLQARWRSIGVATELRSYPLLLFNGPEQSGGILRGGKVDVALSASLQRTLDPSRISILSADAVPPHGNNFAFWRNTRVTQLEDRAATTVDPARRKAAYDEIQRIVARDVPYVTIRWRETIAMHKLGLQGIQPPLVGSTYWNVNRWTF